MSHPEDKKPTPAPVDTAATDKNAQPDSKQPVPRKDPDEYDPVGMAGKKAGILLELGEEANEASKEVQQGSDAKESAGIPGAEKKDRAN